MYIACEELDFYWDPSDVKKFDKHWNDGRALGTEPKYLIKELSGVFNRCEDEIIVMTICRARKGKIKE